VIEGEFEDMKGAETVGFSHSEFGFVVQALDNSAGEQFLSAKIGAGRAGESAVRSLDSLRA